MPSTTLDESPVKDGVKEIRLKSWREFFDLIPQFARGPAYVYRGQANYNWPLVSGLDRLESRYPKRKHLGDGVPDFFNSPPFTEEQHLKAFKRAIRGRRGPNPPPLSEDESWALGQHHGLATPLLDWTRSPFVALFFAFEEEKCFLTSDNWAEPQDRGVYALSTSAIDATRTDTSCVSVLSTESDANYRLISQASVLIRMPRKTDLEGYVTKQIAADDIHQATFIKIKIPDTDRHDCLVALNKMSISHMTLFQDIDGAAKHVNSLWQPGHEDSIAYV